MAKIAYSNVFSAQKHQHQWHAVVIARGGVEGTRLEAKTKDTKKIRGQGQGQPFQRQTLSRPMTGMLEAKSKDTSASALHRKKKRSSQKFFRRSQKKKMVFTKICKAISKRKRFPKNFSSAPQNFSNSKNSAVLEPRTGQFLRLQGQGFQNVSSRPRTSSRTPPMVIAILHQIVLAF